MTRTAICAKCFQPINEDEVRRAVQQGVEYKHPCGRILVRRQP